MLNDTFSLDVEAAFVLVTCMNVLFLDRPNEHLYVIIPSDKQNILLHKVTCNRRSRYMF